jgi:antitoxin (DNA-binding transcriptional repressor) of toxin-antitoxin stability system
MIISVREFRKNLAKYLDLVEKEAVEIQRRDTVVAKLVSVHNDNKPDEVYTPPTEVEKNVYTPKSPQIPKEITEKINKAVKSKNTGLCKICGSVLNQWGECNNKMLHKGAK